MFCAVRSRRAGSKSGLTSPPDCWQRAKNAPPRDFSARPIDGCVRARSSSPQELDPRRAFRSPSAGAFRVQTKPGLVYPGLRTWARPADRDDGLLDGLGGAQSRKPVIKHLLLSKHFRLKEPRNLLLKLPQFIDRHRCKVGISSHGATPMEGFTTLRNKRDIAKLKVK